MASDTCTRGQLDLASLCHEVNVRLTGSFLGKYVGRDALPFCLEIHVRLGVLLRKSNADRRDVEFLGLNLSERLVYLRFVSNCRLAVFTNDCRQLLMQHLICYETRIQVNHNLTLVSGLSDQLCGLRIVQVTACCLNLVYPVLLSHRLDFSTNRCRLHRLCLR